jgi:hypothetical protein
MSQPSLQLDLVAFLAYLAVSARGLVDEPREYGPFRLVDGISRLIALAAAAGVAGEGWTDLQGFVDEHKLEVMDPSADFSAFLDEIVARTVALLEEEE